MNKITLFTLIFITGCAASPYQSESDSSPVKKIFKSGSTEEVCDKGQRYMKYTTEEGQVGYAGPLLENGLCNK